MAAELTWTLGAWTFRIAIMLVGVLVIYLGHQLILGMNVPQNLWNPAETRFVKTILIVRGLLGGLLVLLGCSILMIGLLKSIRGTWGEPLPASVMHEGPSSRDSIHITPEVPGKADTSRGPPN
jgi:hypothetical protein